MCSWPKTKCGRSASSARATARTTFVHVTRDTDSFSKEELELLVARFARTVRARCWSAIRCPRITSTPIRRRRTRRRSTRSRRCATQPNPRVWSDFAKKRVSWSTSSKRNGKQRLHLAARYTQPAARSVTSSARPAATPSSDACRWCATSIRSTPASSTAKTSRADSGLPRRPPKSSSQPASTSSPAAITSSTSATSRRTWTRAIV